MYSVRCANCRQLVTLKPEEMRTIIAEAEAANHVFYSMPCPKCRKPVKLQIKEMKHKLPVATSTPEPTDESNTGQ